jgi:hypothetical protein
VAPFLTAISSASTKTSFSRDDYLNARNSRCDILLGLATAIAGRISKEIPYHAAAIRATITIGRIPENAFRGRDICNLLGIATTGRLTSDLLFLLRWRITFNNSRGHQTILGVRPCFLFLSNSSSRSRSWLCDLDAEIAVSTRRIKLLNRKQGLTPK